jgi:hypothetical protein
MACKAKNRLKILAHGLGNQVLHGALGEGGWALGAGGQTDAAAQAANGAYAVALGVGCGAYGVGGQHGRASVVGYQVQNGGYAVNL